MFLQGGAIFDYGSIVTAKHTVFTNITATTKGAAVADYSWRDYQTATFNATSDEFSGNSAPIGPVVFNAARSIVNDNGGNTGLSVVSW